MEPSASSVRPDTFTGEPRPVGYATAWGLVPVDPETRTVAEVLHAQRTVRGCCGRYVDCLPCDCLAKAKRAERQRAAQKLIDLVEVAETVMAAPIAVGIHGDKVVLRIQNRDPVVLDAQTGLDLAAAIRVASRAALSETRFHPVRADDAHDVGGHD